MKRRLVLVAALALAGPARAAAPELKDFAHGLYLNADGRPAQQLPLPDVVYGRVSRADLGDLRVFNAAGVVVPHALCRGPLPQADAERLESLPVYPLAAARAAAARGETRIDVQTPLGASVHVVEPSATAGAAGAAEGNDVAAHVIDARATRDPLRALRFGWSAGDGASELHVRVEASDDLNAWRTVVPQATLLRADAAGQQLESARVELPLAGYRFLRVERAGGGPAPQITSVVAELVVAASEPEPVRFAAAPRPAGPDEGSFLFDSERLAPVELAAIELPVPNMHLEVALDSRADEASAWQRRWTGSASSVPEVSPAPARFPPVTDRHWRLRVQRGRETLGGASPTLRLGYHPARLQFLAQGGGPYVLAFGSVRVPPAEPAACDALLADMPANQRALLTGLAEAAPAPAARFGGDAAYVPEPKPTPVRQIVLWAVLVAGTLLIVGMALTLLRRLRTDGPGQA